ncbi:hypothetical protein [Nocardia sp. NPDC050406]|uniref:hypothetical protein n=1 Tax=Nocardia sp. NPDC050406 TaxID=3364318 RepID=UPI00378C9363
MTAMFKSIYFRAFAAELVAALAILTAGYSIPSFDNPFACVPHMSSTSEFLDCLGG